MGISNFFSYFFNKNKNHTEEENKFIIEATTNFSVNKLYIDFTNIIYDVIADNPDIVKIQNKIEQEKLLIDKIIERLSEIFGLYPNAEKLIYFECIPMVSKMKEQFTRRLYRKIDDSIDKQIQKILDLNLVLFDYSKISFNSEFINNISRSIKSNFSDCIVYDFINNEIGEAEHRIINDIYVNQDNLRCQDIIIYSPDADVFLLGNILTNKFRKNGKKIIVNTLRRSDKLIDNKRKFYKIDSLKFTDYISRDLNKDKDQLRSIDDLFFLLNLIGDDFLPALENLTIYNLDDIISSLNDLDDEEYLLEIENDEYKINKNVLLKIFMNEKFNSVQYKNKVYLSNVNEKDINDKNFSEIIYEFIMSNFRKGIFLPQNFINDQQNKVKNTVKELTTPKINKNGKKYYQLNKLSLTNIRDDIYKIFLNEPIPGQIKYLTLIDNQIKRNKIYSNDELINYLEGLNFILDLYFNTPGKVKNNYWYYKYNDSPSIYSLICWLKVNNLPNYNNNNITTYFNEDQYKRYLNTLVDDNLKVIFKNGEPNYFKMLNSNGSLYFDCYEKKYLNKCHFRESFFIDPFEFICKDKYLKYKSKYLNLKKMLK